MLELIGFAATAAVTAGGYYQARQYVQRRLQYVEAVHGLRVPVIAGTAAALVAAPVVAILPVVGIGTAVLFGVGVGAGVAAGARSIRRRIGGPA
ncbi:MAG: hypothetical protein ABR499_18435 [Gemmatimonadaceae bacterium]